MLWLVLFGSLLGFNSKVLAQTTTITTVGTGFDAANGLTGSCFITFVIENNNTYDVVLTGVDNFWKTGNTGTVPALWYTATALSGPFASPDPGIASPTWTNITTGTALTITTNGFMPSFTNLNFIIPAGVQYRFALHSTNGISYSGSGAGTPSPNTFSSGGVTLKVHDAKIAAQDIGYSGAFPTSTNGPRSFTGQIQFMPALPCVAPPTGGQATASAPTVCPNVNFQLGLTGASGGQGMTYQWQSSPNGTTGWTNVTGANNANVTISQTTTTYYRAQLTCSGQTANSLPVQVTTNATPVTGTFTINKGAAPSATNFQSFAAAITSIECGGAGGPIIFNVVAGSGPYNEDVVIPVIPGTSATNTVTFNGNGNTLRGTSVTGSPVMKLDGADFIRVNNLKIESEASATAGQTLHLTNGADNNIFTGNSIQHSTSTSSTSYAIYIYTGSNNNNTFTGNTIIGAYYGVYNYGSSTAIHDNNRFMNNTFRDQYYYGFYNYYGTNTFLEGNDISRPTRSVVTTTYYMINMNTGSTGFNISKNRLHNTHDVATSTTGTVYGIYSSSAGTGVGSENMVTNNAIYNINNNGGTLYAIYNTGGNNTHYFYNTVAADDPAVSYSTLRGMYFLSASTNVRFINNNLSLSSNATTKHALYLASTTIALTSNNNNLYVGSTGNVGYYSANQATLANWKAVNSAAYDQASVSADPQFVNTTTGNLRPINATLNNIGAPVAGITDDITGATRSTTTPDPGAYEFTPPTNDASVTAITNPVTPATPGISLPVQVTIKNFGLSALTTATISWTVNGTAQTPFSWTGNLANNATANVTIGNYNFPAGTHTLTICTSLPNGAVDPNPGNDCQTLTFIACNQLAGTYTINKGAPASATNFQSFTAAINNLNSCGFSAPVIFNVVANSGPYLEHVIIPAFAGVSATNTITFNGNGNILRGTSAAGTPVMMLDGADYIRVNNLNLEAEANATAGQVLHLTNGADNNMFTGNTFKHSITTTSTSYAVYIYTGSNNNNTFTGNTMIGGYYGVYNYGTSATVLQNNNRFINNTIRDHYYYGIYNYYATNTLIEGNDISRPNRTVVTTTYYMINMNTGSTGYTISKNRLHNTHDAATTTTGTIYGIYTSAAGTGVGSENMVKNNAIYNINNNGGTLYAIYNTGGNNTHYYYNTISADLANVSYTTLRGMYFLSASTNVRFINNNISLSSTATTKHALYLSSTTIALTSNNNNLYVGSSGNVGYYSAAQATLANWQAVNSGAYDQASVSVDPQFVNLATGDLRPTIMNLNDIAQVVAGITDDLTGAVRSATTPDIGAFEFTLYPNDLGVTGITGITSGCGLTSTQTITITVRNFGTTAQSNVPVNFMVGTAIIGTGTISGPIAPGATVTYVFTTTANLGAPGAYIITASTLLTGDGDPSNNSFTLNVTNSNTATPTVTTAGTTTFCTGGSVGLTAASTTTGATYQWYKDGTLITGATSATYTANATGSYTVVATANSCPSAASVATTVTANAVAATPTITSAGITTFCTGGSVGLTAASTTTGATYQWYKDGTLITGANAATYNANAAGNYTVIASANGCPSTASAATTVIVNTAPTTPTITQNGGMLTSSTGTGYQWYIGGVLIPGATGQTLITTTNGNYTVVVTGTNGCASAPSAVKIVTNTGLGDALAGMRVQVYPNPASGSFNVKLSGYQKDATLALYSLTGQRILTEQASADGNARNISLNGLAAGTYLLKVTSDQGVQVTRLIVQ